MLMKWKSGLSTMKTNNIIQDNNFSYYKTRYSIVDPFVIDTPVREAEILALPKRYDWNVETSSRVAQYNTLAWESPWAELKDFVKYHWAEYAKILGVRPEIYAQGWLNVFRVGNSFPAHVHDCPFHGVFIVKGGDSFTRFYYTDLRGRTRIHDIKSEDGTLILVPGWYYHEVSPWVGPGLRITMAFDMFYDDWDFGRTERSATQTREEVAYTCMKYAVPLWN
jgi:hypothetical protein